MWRQASRPEDERLANCCEVNLVSQALSPRDAACDARRLQFRGRGWKLVLKLA